MLVVLATAPAAHAATLYVAPGGSGSGCTANSPCGSLETAYRAARPGDGVRIAGGAYGGQRLPALGRPAPAIELAAAPGADVRVDGLDVEADNVVVRGIRSTSFLNVTRGSPDDPAENVRFMDMHSRTHWISGARNFTWKGGSIGPYHNESLHKIGGTPASHGLTYDGVLWHDATRDGADVHTECLLALGPQGLTIRNSRFTNCAVFDVLIGRIGSDPAPRDIVVENTVFEASRDVDGSRAYYTFMTTGGDRIDGLTLRNNVWELGISLQSPMAGARISGNIGEAASCTGGVAYSHNIFADRSCDRSDRRVSSAFRQFVDAPGHDWRLTRGAAAVDAADPNDYPATDAAGLTRPAGGAPDAGAHEYGASAGGPGPAKDRPAQAPAGRAKRLAGRVVSVIDGETLSVRLRGGRRLKLRLLGIDVPFRPGRCGAAASRAFLRRLALGHKVRIVAARPGPDSRGRTAAVLRDRHGELAPRLLRAGWARARPSELGSRRRGGYLAAQRRARAQPRGLWRRCGR